MFGFADWGVTAAFLITLASAALCVIYGLAHWNTDDTPMPPPVHPKDEPDVDSI